MSLTPKNWNTFQHYKDRSPAWVKLHKGLLTDFKFARLPIASKALAPLLWLLASEYEGGKITASLEEISFRVSIPEDQLHKALKPLIDGGFFIDDSEMLADCKQDATPEKETEEQDKTEKDIRTVASATRPANDDDFENFWKAYPKRKGGNPKQPARQLFLAAVKLGLDPKKITAAVAAGAGYDREKIGTEYIPQAVKWLRDRRWEEYLDGTEADNSRRASVFLSCEDPRYAAWLKHLGKTSTPLVNGGWWFDAEAPPNAAA